MAATRGGQPGGPGTVVQVAVGGSALYWTVDDVTQVPNELHGQVMRFMP